MLALLDDCRCKEMWSVLKPSMTPEFAIALSKELFHGNSLKFNNGMKQMVPECLHDLGRVRVRSC